jgi:hypothetical protein
MSKENRDPRWQEAEELRQRRAELEDKGDAMGYLDGWRRYTAKLEAIAADGLTPEDRADAQKILDDITIQCRAAMPGTLQCLAELAETAVDADVREQARNTLMEAIRRLPVASDKIN